VAGCFLPGSVQAVCVLHHQESGLADLGGIPLVHSPSDFGSLIADDTAKWAKVIRAANIKPE